MSEKCQGTLKNGNPCAYKASWIHTTGSFCKKHAPSGSEEISEARSRVSASASASASPTTASASASRKSAVSLPLLYNEIFEGIKRRLQSGDLRETQQIAGFLRMDLNDRCIIIQRSMELCGCKDDILRIAGSMGQAVDAFRQVCDERRLPIELRNHHLETLGATWRDKETSDAFLFERGNRIHFRDVDIVIGNCSPVYLEMLGVDFDELSTDSSIIYMGPKGAAKTPMGSPLPPEDSEWYIPLPSSCPLRQLHNKTKTSEILNGIAEGREKKEKYLDLRGKILLCLCMPSPCHCEVYVEVVRALTKR